MRLTLHTDYAFRILLFLRATDARVTAEQIAEAYGISKNHIQKVVQTLVREGYLESSRGRGGGIRLARAPAAIILGDVVRATEPDLHLVECLAPETNTCPIAGACGLTAVLREAGLRFLGHLDGYTLADLGKATPAFRARLGIGV